MISILSSKTPPVLQTEITECGLACLAYISTVKGHSLSLKALRAKYGVSSRGLKLSRLLAIAENIGFKTKPLRVNVEYLNEIKLPVILYWGFNHYVVLTRVESNKYHIMDPEVGNIVVDKKRFGENFTGIVVTFESLEAIGDFCHEKTNSPQNLIINLFNSWASDNLKIIALITTASAILSLTLISLSFVLKFLVDAVYPSGSKFIAIITLIFLIFISTMFSIASFKRDKLLVYLSAKSVLKLAEGVYSKIFLNNHEWFAKRSTGDLLVKLRSVDEITSIFVESIPKIIISIVLVITTGIALFILAPALACAIFLVAGLKTSIFYYFRNKLVLAQLDVLQAEGRVTQSATETLTSLSTVKGYGIERIRYLSLASLKTRHVQMQSVYNILTSKFKSIISFTALAGGHSTTVIAIIMAINGTISLGTVIALLPMREAFLSAVDTLLDMLIDVREAQMHGGRIDDLIANVTGSKIKPHVRIPDGFDSIKCHSINIEKLGLKYDEDWIFKDLSARLTKTGINFILGPSGAGKSSLLMVLQTAIEPSEGTVFIDDVNQKNIPPEIYKDWLGVVTQHDNLFFGSILDNITLSETNVDIERVKRCCELAEIEDFIQKLPMSYSTIVNTALTPFSGGQIQRLILARALYRDPKILLLDEATANVDPNTERRIFDNIRKLDCIVISVTHKISLTQAEDNIIKFG